MKLRLNDLSVSEYVTGLTNGQPTGLSFHPSGDLYITNYSQRILWKWNGTTLARVLDASNFTTNNLLDVKIDKQGFIYISLEGANGSIRKYAPNLTSYTNVASNVSAFNMSLTSNQSLVFANNLGENIYRFQTGPLISGTATSANYGVHPVTIRMTDGVNTVNQSFNITVNPTPPTFSNLPASITFLEDQYPAYLNNALSGGVFRYTDAGNDKVSLKLTVSKGNLGIASPGSLDVSFDRSTEGTVVLIGTVTDIEQYLDVNTNLFYSTPLNLNGTNAVTLTVSAKDLHSENYIILGTVNFNITAVNDAPTISAPASINLVNNQSNAITGISFADVDAADNDVTVEMSTTQGLLSISSGSGVTVASPMPSVFSLTGSITNINAFIAAGNVKYTTGITTPEEFSLNVSINDKGNSGSGGALSANKTVTLKLDKIAPKITSVSVPANSTSKIGDNLNFTINFDENVIVNSSGTKPRVSLLLGTVTRYAEYVNGSGTTQLTFRYTIQSGDLDNDGITLGSLALNGGTLKDAAGNDAVLTLNNPGSTTGILVDGVAPTLTISKDPDYSLATGQTATITFTFSENPGSSFTWDGTDGDVVVTGGELSAISGTGLTRTATFTPTPNINNGTATISVSAGSYTDAVGNAGGSKTLNINYDTKAPAAPTGVVATHGNGKITINWTANTETDISLYKVYKSTSTTFPSFGDIATSTTYTDNDVSNGTTYYYKIVATDLSANNSGFSTIVSATPKATQSITFNSIATKTYGDASFSLGSANSSVGLTITYVAADPTIVSISGNQATILKPGTTKITAKQAGSIAYEAATDVEQTLTVNKKALTATAQAVSKIYDGGTDATINFNDLTGLVGTDKASVTYTSASYNNKNVGADKAITINGLVLTGAQKDYYSLNTFSTTGNITPAILRYVATPSTKIYGENNPILTGTVTGFVSGDNQANATTGTLAFNTTTSNTSSVGTYAINGSSLTAQNYTLEQAAANATAFTIKAKSISITADDKSKTYGDVDPILSYHITSGNLVNGDNFTGSLSRQVGEEAGTYSINQNSVALSTNYNLSYEGATFTINKAILTVTANTAERCYGDNNPSFGVSYSGFKFNDNANNLTTLPLVNTEANASSSEGNYILISSGAQSNNYTFNYVNGILTITPLPLNTITSNKGLSISKGETAELSVSSDNGISYNWNNADGILSGQNSSTLTVRPLQTTTYTVVVRNANGCESTNEITIEVKEDYQAVKAENFITPNGDGVNDTWVVENIDSYPNHTLIIVDRSGREVFSVRNYQNDWAGTLNGIPLASGTYYYVFRFDQNQPRQPFVKGFITIIR